MALAMAAMVGCNKDAEEVVIVSNDAPSVNGTWVSVDDEDYTLVISGNKFTATYPVTVYEWDGDFNSWEIKLDDNNDPVTELKTFEFTSGKITADEDAGYISFVSEFTTTLYGSSVEKTMTSEAKVFGTSLAYSKINNYLSISTWSGYTVPSVSSEEVDNVTYSAKNTGADMILDGYYTKQ